LQKGLYECEECECMGVYSVFRGFECVQGDDAQWELCQNG